MPHINLLPWREELRRRKQKNFGIMAGVAVALMCGVIAGVHVHFVSRIDFQKERNTFLESEIAKLRDQITEIKDLKREKDRLLARTAKIQQLQSGRPNVVHLMDEVVATLPDGVFYTGIVQRGGAVTLNGVAQSNARVSSLMRRLEASDWLENPGLLEIKASAQATSPIRSSTFSLNIKQTQATETEGEEPAS